MKFVLIAAVFVAGALVGATFPKDTFHYTHSAVSSAADLVSDGAKSGKKLADEKLATAPTQKQSK